MLTGIDDVPAIAQDVCWHCGKLVPDDCWFAFEKSGTQMFLVPVCDNCNSKANALRIKAED